MFGRRPLLHVSNKVADGSRAAMAPFFGMSLRVDQAIPQVLAQLVTSANFRELDQRRPRSCAACVVWNDFGSRSLHVLRRCCLEGLQRRLDFSGVGNGPHAAPFGA